MRAPSSSRLLCSAAALAALTLAGPLAAQDDDPGASTDLMASLTGMEAPAGGDPDGSGMFDAELDADELQLCYDLRVANIAQPTAAHIHRGPEGETGPPVVTLEVPALGAAAGCVEIEADLAAELAASPGAFYVNVHNEEFGGGAVRGQLEIDAVTSR